MQSIDNTRWLMWVVAAAIVASMLYVAALERKRDFAVLEGARVLLVGRAVRRAWSSRPWW